MENGADVDITIHGDLIVRLDSSLSILLSYSLFWEARGREQLSLPWKMEFSHKLKRIRIMTP